MGSDVLGLSTRLFIIGSPYWCVQAQQMLQVADGQQAAAAQQEQMAELQQELDALEARLAQAVQTYRGPGSAELQEELSRSLAHIALQSTRRSLVRGRVDGSLLSLRCNLMLGAAKRAGCVAIPLLQMSPVQVREWMDWRERGIRIDSGVPQAGGPLECEGFWVLRGCVLCTPAGLAAQELGVSGADCYSRKYKHASFRELRFAVSPPAQAHGAACRSGGQGGQPSRGAGHVRQPRGPLPLLHPRAPAKVWRGQRAGGRVPVDDPAGLQGAPPLCHP